ncbi:MAG TPA: septum formation family protein [Acidimicrobiales bacterium]|nr:septum formation family protein [Acidimicrobiales bacterium]
MSSLRIAPTLLSVLAAVGVAAGLAGCSSGGPRAGAQLSVFHLHPGDCVLTPTAVKAELSSLKVVSCREPHTEEVYALAQDKSGQTYPGTTALQKFADGACLQSFAGYVGDDYRDSSLFYTYLLPSVRSWAAGDHTVDCVVTTTGRSLTRSVKNSHM